jgi:hypothetical protein
MRHVPRPQVEIERDRRIMHRLWNIVELVQSHSTEPEAPEVPASEQQPEPAPETLNPGDNRPDNG